MKLFLKGLIVGTIMLAATTVAMAAQLTGIVAGVQGLDVTVKVDGQLMPAAGDQVEISFSLPDGEALPIGIWEITQVNGNIAIASVKNNTGNPVIGHKAVISSKNPVPRRNINKVEQQNTYSYTSNTTTIASGEAQQVIELIRSPSAAEKRNGAKIASKRFADNAAVMAVAAEELEKGFTENLRDGHHVDAMAWLCNALGASKDIKYAALLKKVYRKSRSRKIKKYAKKNYNRVR